MRWAVPFAALIVSFAAAAQTSPETFARPEPSPSDQTLVFYNARIALRDHRPADVLKLWLLRNSLAQRGEPGTHDAEFRSVVWAALGDLGLCQDGFANDDEGGAGLWPLALHNWLAQSLAKGPPESAPSSWEIFDVGRQQRLVSLYDVLSADELKTVSFFRSGCLRARTALLQFQQEPWADLEDRLTVGLLMRDLLELSKRSLRRDRVESVAVIEARLFDLDLALADLQARRARRQAHETAQQARMLGVSEAGAAEVRKTEKKWPENSRQAAFLRRSLTWRADEWLSLNQKRRLSLFAQARPLATDKDALDRLTLSVIDALIDQKSGEELQSWIGFLDASGSQALRDAVTLGERGKRLLELEPSTGFKERAVVSLHRGVAFLAAGQLQDALRSFAYSLRHADESTEADTTRALGRRWLSFVLSRYQTTDEVIDTLKALVPRQEYNAVIEDLVWRAALRADQASFDRVTESARHGGSFDARVERLRFLSQGKPGEMATLLRDEMKESPHAVLRFVRELLDNLETENAEVRRANVPTLRLLAKVLRPLATGDSRGSQTRQAEELLVRMQSILDGLEAFDLSEQGEARAMSPTRETFAGSIRLAPADALPWPFRAPETEAPSAFAPLVLTPVEWRDDKGALVFGWRLSE